MEMDDSLRRGLDQTSSPRNSAWKRKTGLLRRTPGYSNSPLHYRSTYKYSRAGISSTSAGSSHSVGDALLENLNSALRALGSTPSKVGLKSPIPIMQSLDEEQGETVYSTPRQRPVSVVSPTAPDVTSPNSAQKLMDIQQKHSSLLNECAELETQVLKSEKRREALHKQLVELDSDVKKMKQVKQGIDNDIQDLQSQEDAKKRDVAALDGVLQQKEVDLYTMEGQIRDARDRLCDIQSRIKHLQQEESSTKSSVENLQRHLESVEGNIERKEAKLEDLTVKYEQVHHSLLDAMSRKDELTFAAKEAEDKIRDGEETVKKLERLTSEGCFLVEDQSQRAAVAQEEWERAERRLGEIQSEIVESSARLEAKQSMLKELDRKLAPYAPTEDNECRHLGQDIEKQRILLAELERTNRLKFEETIALGKHIESLKQQRGHLLLSAGSAIAQSKGNSSGGDASSLDTEYVTRLKALSEENDSLKKSLQEALHEVERLSHMQQSILISEALENRLQERENELEKAVCAANIMNWQAERVERKADHAENAYVRMRSMYEAAQEHIKDLEHAQSDVGSRICRDERCAENRDTEKNGGLMERLKREKTEALERIHRLTQETDLIRSSLRKETRRRHMTKSLLHHDLIHHRLFIDDASQEIPAIHPPESMKIAHFPTRWSAVSTLPFAQQQLCKHSIVDKRRIALPTKRIEFFSRDQIRGLGRTQLAVRDRLRLRALPSSGEVLQSLLSWMIANGAKGLDGPDSKISLFVSNDGERGLIATKDVPKGSILFQIPMRLALIDDEPGSPDCEIDFDAGVPWSVRLACKLLRLKAQGADSPWKPYLDSLPGYVPSATALTFSYESIKQIGYAHAREQIDFLSWLSISSYESLPPGACPHGITYEEFSHALSIVHSRTFSVPAKDRRGSIVRLLMPLVDMLNHSGDVDVSMSHEAGQDVIATDAVRWDCVAKIGGEFEMIVSATRDIVRGEEVTLSYGERSNDDFFLYYGFVPPRNPHDSVELFGNLSEALAWALSQLSGSITKKDVDAIETSMNTFIQKNPDLMQPITNEIKDFEPLDSKRLAEDKTRIVLQSKGRVDERLVVVLEELHNHIQALLGEDSKSRFVQRMIAGRSFEILAGMKKRCNAVLTEDLEKLSLWESNLAEPIEEDDVLCHQFTKMAALYVPRINQSVWFEQLSHVEEDSVTTLDTSNIDSCSGNIGEFNMPEALSTAATASNNDSILPIIYRAYKQCILWDTLLAI